MTYQDVFATYEAKRDQLRAWAAEHYISDFGLTSGKLLDASCGDGFWSGLFADAGFTVKGIDSRGDLIAEARRKHPDIPFSTRDMEKPLVALGKFDVVFVRTVPQFYQPTLERGQAVVANLLRHLNPAGVLLLSIYSDASGQDRPTVAGGVAHHHSDAVLLKAIGEVGRVTRTVRVGNYLQIAVTAQ